MRMRSVVVGLAVALLLPGIGVAQSNIFRSAYSDPSDSNATGIATGDFDGSGNTSVLTTNAGNTNEINIAVGFGDGTVSRNGEIELSSLPSALVAANFDGDSIPDLVVALANDTAITFLHGRADENYFDPPATPIEVGGSPAGLTAVDFDGDGKLDVIAANDGGDSSPGSVSFLRGDGLGGFTLVLQTDPAHPAETVEAIPADSGTRAVAAGNIDGDAALEVLAVNTRANTISIFDGDGHGFFTPGGSLSTGRAPQDLRLTDVNGDGKLDLIVANSNDDSVTVQFGNGDKTFGAATVYEVGTAPSRIALGDMDRNGTTDIVVSNVRSGDVTVLRGDGMGAFGGARSWVAEAEPQVLALADFNNDGELDIVTAAQGGGDGGAVIVQRNRGDGVLQAVEDIAVGNSPTAIASADLDDDGHPDLITGGANGVISIQYARPDGFSAGQTVTVGGRALAVLAVDLNGDAQPDLAAVDNDNDRVVVALATGAATFGTPQFYSVSVGPSAITAGDFNGDGRVDLAVSAIGPPGRASVLLQQANGTFGPARSTEVQETPIGIAAVDANCDGKDDLIVSNQASGVVSVLRSVGDGTFTTVQELPSSQVGTAPLALAVADFNRDGVDDFAVSDAVAPGNSPSFRTFLGACDGPFTFKDSNRAGDLISSMVARDFTGDGLVDVGMINQTSNAMRVLTGKGTGSFSSIGQPDAVSRMPVALAAADFDLDGRYDAATANSDPSANNLSVLYNCARDEGCSPFPVTIPGKAALRGDGNSDGVRSAADFVAVSREVMDGDGYRVEDINNPTVNPTGYPGDPGADANGDGLVNAQDRRAVAHRIFGGA